MIKTKLIPDSSFFICYLDDIKDHYPIEKRYDYLNRILTAFKVEVTTIVIDEVGLNNNHTQIKSNITLIDTNSLKISSISNIIEPLRPIFGKGEYEVILVAFYYYQENENNFKFILDEKIARNIIKNHISELEKYLIGTIGLIDQSNIVKLYTKDEAIDLLEKIKDSKFRIDTKIIDDVINKIKSRC